MEDIGNVSGDVIDATKKIEEAAQQKDLNLVDIEEKPQVGFSFNCPVCKSTELLTGPVQTAPEIEMYYVVPLNNAPSLQKITPEVGMGMAVCTQCKVQFGYTIMVDLSVSPKGNQLTDEQFAEMTKPQTGCAGCGPECDDAGCESDAQELGDTGAVSS